MEIKRRVGSLTSLNLSFSTVLTPDLVSSMSQWTLLLPTCALFPLFQLPALVDIILFFCLALQSCSVSDFTIKFLVLHYFLALLRHLPHSRIANLTPSISHVTET